MSDGLLVKQSSTNQKSLLLVNSDVLEAVVLSLCAFLYLP